jgi:hypothetical protein
MLICLFFALICLLYLFTDIKYIIQILFNHKKRKKLKVVNFKKIVLQCILAGMYFQFLLTFFSTFPP